MFGKNTFEAIVLSTGLLAGCGDSLEINTTENNKPNLAGSGGTSLGGSGGAAGYEAGKAGVAGHSGKMSQGGEGGSAGTAGYADCNLINGAMVTPAVLNPQGGIGSITFNLAKTSAVSVLINNQNQTIKNLISGVEKSPGQYTFKWDGKNTSGETVADGSYQAVIMANSKNCHEQENIAIKVKNGIKKCLMGVDYSTSGTPNITVPVGSPDITMVCLGLLNNQCNINVSDLTLGSQGLGFAHDDILNGRLTIDGELSTSQFSDFSIDDRIHFNKINGLNLAPSTSATVCLKADVSKGANIGDTLKIGLNSATDLKAVSNDGEEVEITGSFPIMGPEVNITSNIP